MLGESMNMIVNKRKNELERLTRVEPHFLYLRVEQDRPNGQYS